MPLTASTYTFNTLFTIFSIPNFSFSSSAYLIITINANTPIQPCRLCDIILSPNLCSVVHENSTNYGLSVFQSQFHIVEDGL